MAHTAADPRGLKRICPSCGTRYYDFNKRPAVCPNCKAEFTTEAKAKGRARRSPANDEASAIAKKGLAVSAAENEEEDDVEIADDDLVSLDEVEEMEEGDDDLDEDDIDIDEDLENLDDLEEDELDEEEEAAEEDDE